MTTMLSFKGLPASIPPPSVRDRVLLVDDDPVVLEAVSSILEPEFYVECMDSAERAWCSVLETTSWSAVVCDLGLPDMSGLDLLKRIKDKDRDLPVVVLTSDSSLETAVRVMEFSGFRYLTKSSTNAVILEAVRAACATRRMDLLRRRAFEFCRASGWDAHHDEKLGRILSRAMRSVRLAYQPIISAESGEVFGYEALLRSRSVELSNPGLIFDAAESLGRVRELGRVVRANVAADMAKAPEGVPVFVNLHPLELGDAELVARDAPLTRHAERVVLEITERASLNVVPDLAKTLNLLRALGYRIAVDDLGSGYAGLSSFSDLKPDIAKLDMSLIRGIDTCRMRQSLVRCMLEVCREDLGTRVVCEGIETVAEYQTLRQLGADLLQGYLFARPSTEFVVPSIEQAKLTG